jgi:hypothetical protein
MIFVSTANFGGTSDQARFTEVFLSHLVDPSMSALGHKQTSRDVRVMSVISLKGDIHLRGLHVCLVPLADIRGARRLAH